MTPAGLQSRRPAYRAQLAARVGDRELKMALAVDEQPPQARLQTVPVGDRIEEDPLAGILGVPHRAAPELQGPRFQPPVGRFCVRVVLAGGQRTLRSAVEGQTPPARELESAVQGRLLQRSLDKTVPCLRRPGPPLARAKHDAVQPDREERLGAGHGAARVRIAHGAPHPHLHVHAGSLRIQSPPLRELHKLTLGQLNRQPAGLDGVFQDPRAVRAELLQFDRDGGTVRGALRQQVALKNHLLPGELAHVDPLRDGHLAAGILRRLLVDHHLKGPPAGGVSESPQADRFLRRHRPTVRQAVGLVLETVVGQQVLRRQKTRLILPSL